MIMESSIQSNVQVDPQVLRKIAIRIINEEHKNLTTKKYTSAQMVERALRIIRLEVEKDEN